MTAAGDDGIGTPTSARSGYGAGLFDHRRRLEVQRLRALEAYNDPATQSVILARGVQPGWRCLELGGGAGSIARWLAAHSAPGEVVVTDLDTRLLPRGIPNLTVLRHDVVHDDFPAASFDLVHARALLEHLPKPTDVLAKMVRWTAPGGWVCVDDLISIRPPGGPRDAHQRCWNALVTLAEGTMRIDQHWAATLPRLFAAQGLTDIGVHCTPGLVGGSGNATEFIRIALEQLGTTLVERCLITDRDLAEGRDLLADPHYSDLVTITFSAWGRRPST
ncbi:class I SAM-dependent methyltransferase [Streptomyces clavuligerus]|uniref:Putative methyltransferase n=1 Tax=Streptomyces clavuligerus TaxID=1901 RepID=B5GW43_STRCL|nr:class I SAM-dependent methyltransferase [Streptomyces clavuligerus]EDY50539.1 methyltransferase type 12 [Streptomyces clavuligerus]EFG03564.1 Putative methyltransferase [Streptomyces clavuligerus]MBY6307856.1 class I SAM-dependent methyltransferase [Streptomyces clavuligerus]QCS09591.1 methyltransferase domain-containing protein [Streptomyces clavuligerus]QPJ98358.1 methyltransferase domain-containing protein [Streptomyces clavuligerus]